MTVYEIDGEVIESPAKDLEVVDDRSLGGRVRDLLIRVDDRQVERVVLAETEEGTWVHWRGKTRLVTSTSASRSRAAVDGSLVTPPFPATVAAVLVEAGQRVDEGQPLVVITAMKTEMTLKARAAGTVSSVGVLVGDSVNPGERLVEISCNDREG